MRIFRCRLRWLATRAVLLVAGCALGWAAGCGTGWAAGPRWVTGPPYFYPVGYPVAWYTDAPQYFTDPGDLSQYVTHAQADALVAAAAAVWTVPTSRLVLARGGLLNEHVSSANVTVGGGGLVFPADVQASNGPNKQIAVIYDANGSVTELMLGGGASDPTNCMHAGVTESVDGMPQSSYTITHALLIVNGRCTGPAPEQQLELQYQLMRAFGRVLGLSWSQTNDNVYTGTPQATYNQALNWPIMHPLEIVCGLYTYQCLPNPFTLRADDIASLDTVYFISQGYVPAGKEATLAEANLVEGQVVFPDGQGMEGVNVTVQRDQAFYDDPEPWQSVSGVSGYLYRRQGPTPALATNTSAAGSYGVIDPSREGYYRIQRVPIPAGQAWQNLVVSTEPINPLYTGPYTVGPYTRSQVTESGTTGSEKIWVLANYSDTEVDFGPAGAPVTCGASGDGTEAAPSAGNTTGWWSGVLCGYGHASWTSFPVKANRSFTVEVTAVDEHGAPTVNKALPTMGIWNAADATGTLPTVAATASPLNSLTLGMTNLTVPATTGDRSLRMSVADGRGDGRPDFAYGARVLYADSVAPATVGAAGEVVTISGMGFRAGNIVLVNGGPATVESVTANAIVARVPASLGAGAHTGFTATVTVKDTVSGGASVMSGALTYLPGADTVQLVTVPSGTATLNVAAATAFAVKVVGTDGVSPLPGRSIIFSATAGGMRWGACPAATIGSNCTVVTNAQGVASTTLTPTAAGAVTVQATANAGVLSGSFTAAAAVLSVVAAPTGPVTVGTAAGTAFSVRVMAADGVTPMAGTPVIFAVASGAATLGACGAGTCTVTTDASGLAATTAMPTAAGGIGLTASVAGATPVTAAFTGVNEGMHLLSAPMGTLTVGVPAATPFAVRVLRGDGVTPVANESVAFAVTGGVARLGACGAATCAVPTDASGLAQMTVTPMAAGSISLSATGSAGTVGAAFLAATPAMQLLSAPGGTLTTGSAGVFAVKVLAGDGVSPMAGVAVGISAAGAAVRFGSCMSVPCSLLTDANGVASTSVTPTGVGQVTLTAAGLAGTVTAGFLSAPETIHGVSAPAGAIGVGQVAASPFAVEVLAGDGVTPVAGETVLFSVTGGAVLGACGGTSCAVVTSAGGLASTTVTATSAGAVVLLASVSAGSVSASLTAAARTITAARQTEYLAEGATVVWDPEILLTDSTGSAAGTVVTWSGVPGMMFAGTSSLSSMQGTAEMTAVLGPLAAGARTAGAVCAWSSVCTTVSAVGVGPAQLQVTLSSGGGQAVNAAGTLGAVTFLVTDGAGHGVAGVPVGVLQTVSAWSPGCPASGRCPAAAVYRSTLTTEVSDVDGMVTVTPAQMAGEAERTEVAVVAGTAGFATATLLKQP